MEEEICSQRGTWMVMELNCFSRASTYDATLGPLRKSRNMGNLSWTPALLLFTCVMFNSGLMQF